jgi:hypothetical protein
MKYQKRLRATTLFLANRFMRYTLHMAESAEYFSLGTKRPTTWYCDCPVGSAPEAFLPIEAERLWMQQRRATASDSRCRQARAAVGTHRECGADGARSAACPSVVCIR